MISFNKYNSFSLGIVGLLLFVAPLILSGAHAWKGISLLERRPTHAHGRFDTKTSDASFLLLGTSGDHLTPSFVDTVKTKTGYAHEELRFTTGNCKKWQPVTVCATQDTVKCLDENTNLVMPCLNVKVNLWSGWSKCVNGTQYRFVMDSAVDHAEYRLCVVEVRDYQRIKDEIRKKRLPNVNDNETVLPDEKGAFTPKDIDDIKYITTEDDEEEEEENPLPVQSPHPTPVKKGEDYFYLYNNLNTLEPETHEPVEAKVDGGNERNPEKEGKDVKSAKDLETETPSPVEAKVDGGNEGNTEKEGKDGAEVLEPEPVEAKVDGGNEGNTEEEGKDEAAENEPEPVEAKVDGGNEGNTEKEGKDVKSAKDLETETPSPVEAKVDGGNEGNTEKEGKDEAAENEPEPVEAKVDGGNEGNPEEEGKEEAAENEPEPHNDNSSEENLSDSITEVPEEEGKEEAAENVDEEEEEEGAEKEGEEYGTDETALKSETHVVDVNEFDPDAPKLPPATIDEPVTTEDDKDEEEGTEREVFRHHQLDDDEDAGGINDEEEEGEEGDDEDSDDEEEEEEDYDTDSDEEGEDSDDEEEEEEDYDTDEWEEGEDSDDEEGDEHNLADTDNDEDAEETHDSDDDHEGDDDTESEETNEQEETFHKYDGIISGSPTRTASVVFIVIALLASASYGYNKVNSGNDMFDGQENDADFVDEEYGEYADDDVENKIQIDDEEFWAKEDDL